MKSTPNKKKSDAREKIQTLEPLILMSSSPYADGTDGNDLLIALEPGEVLLGGDGDDVLIGHRGNSALFGGDGDDLLIVRAGNNAVDGGNGDDTAVFANGRRADFIFVKQDDDTVTAQSDGSNTWLASIESVRFLDGKYSMDELLVSSPGPSNGEHEYRTIDGTDNNPYDSQLGSTKELLIRLGTVEYSDGVSAPAGDDRPGAREISNAVAAQTTTVLNDRNMTDYVWLWGQFLDHDLDLSDGASPAEPFNIIVPGGDSFFDPSNTDSQTIGMNRSTYETNPETGAREQINEITAFLDGSNVYGSDDVRAAALRAFEGGHLLTSEGDLLPFNTEGLNNANGTSSDLFLAGDVRANENVALTAMHTLWVREHNRIADNLAEQEPWLSDEELYQQAREIVIAELQVITYNEFLPALLGDHPLDDYTGYKPYVDPSIANEFSTAAYRIGHTLLSAELQRQNNDGSQAEEGDLALRDAFFSPTEISNHGIDSLLKGISLQAANEVDNQIVDDVRNFLFGPPGAGGFDLASLNIQRGRDHGLADYNQMRVNLGLSAVSDFDEITSDVELQNKLRDLYGSVDKIDLWVGGLAEDHVDGGSVGETFRTILIDQFSRLRDGDRFWYQNVLSGDELELVETTTLAQVIERNSSVRNLQDNIFFLDSSSDDSSSDDSPSVEYEEHSNTDCPTSGDDDYESEDPMLPDDATPSHHGMHGASLTELELHSQAHSHQPEFEHHRNKERIGGMRRR